MSTKKIANKILIVTHKLRNVVQHLDSVEET